VKPATRIALFAVGACAGTAGCSHGSSATSAGDSGTPGAAAPSATVAGAPPVPAALAVIGGDNCVFGHRGVLLDLGDPATRLRGAAGDRGRVDTVERDGATWTRIAAHDVSLPFVATADDVAESTADGAVPVVEARVRGGSARSVAVFLNGKAAGNWTLAKGETHVVSFKLETTGASAAELVTGTNELLLHFRGAAKSGASAPDEEAEIDWIHVGGSKPDEPYSAPTRADAITSVTLGKTPMRAVSLRAPGYARCSGWLPADGHLVTSVGALGAGDADLELRVVRDRAPPVVLAAMHVTSDAGWSAVDLPIAGKGPVSPGPASPGKGTLGAIELVAVRAAKGVRVVFGDPRVVSPPAPPVPASAPPAVKGVVLVVEGDVAPRLLELYAAGGTALPELGALAKQGVVFEANRASGGASSSSLASMLTALPARAHGVVGEESGLARDATTLADVARQAGIHAAMFTAVPTTGSAFGFSRGWDTFAEHPPDLGEAPGGAVAPFDDAARWIADPAARGDRFLVVVHARGGHPPWDATPDEMRSLAPADYTGGIDPKRAAELLSRARPATGPGPRATPLRLNDADRTRAWALYALALKEHDAALGRLLAALKAAGRDADTLVVFAGDVGLGAARAPLEDPDPLSEPALSTPLVVRFPESPAATAIAGHRVAVPTTSADVARTIVDAFGLSPPAAFEGQDLARVALTGATLDARGRPLLAVEGGRFALRWGTFVLRGSQSDVPGDSLAPDITKLCDVSLEPECTSDVRGAFPIALAALRRELAAQTQSPHAPTTVVETPAVQGSLRLWGL
jgi:arylsulfatase A-like enzyme